MKNMLLSLVLLMTACGVSVPESEQTMTTKGSLASLVWYPPHNQNGNWQCQESCAATASAYPPTRCPCVLHAPPGAVGFNNSMFNPQRKLPKTGETMLCSEPNLHGFCFIIPVNTSYDCFWLSLAGWESIMLDGTKQGINSMLLGPKTQFWYSNDLFFGPWDRFIAANIIQNTADQIYTPVWNVSLDNWWICSVFSTYSDPI